MDGQTDRLIPVYPQKHVFCQGTKRFHPCQPVQAVLSDIGKNFANALRPLLMSMTQYKQGTFLDYSDFEGPGNRPRDSRKSEEKGGGNSLRYCCTLIIINCKQNSIVIIITPVLNECQGHQKPESLFDPPTPGFSD